MIREIFAGIIALALLAILALGLVSASPNEQTDTGRTPFQIMVVVLTDASDKGVLSDLINELLADWFIKNLIVPETDETIEQVEERLSVEGQSLFQFMIAVLTDAKDNGVFPDLISDLLSGWFIENLIAPHTGETAGQVRERLAAQPTPTATATYTPTPGGVPSAKLRAIWSYSPWAQTVGAPISVQVSLNWNTPDGYGITNYVAQLYEHNGDEFDLPLTGAATFGDTQTVGSNHSLQVDTNYKYALTLRNTANETIVEEDVTIFIRSTAENPATEAPTNLTASLASDGSRVVLRWDAPEGNLWRYEVIRDWRLNGSVAATQNYVVDKDHTTYTDTNVGSSSGRTYEYRVRAVTGFYTSYDSEVGSVQIPSATPTQTQTPIAGSTATLTPTATATYTPAPTATYTPAPIATPTYIPTPTATATYTPAPIATATYTPAPIATPTYTPAPTATATYTPTPGGVPSAKLRGGWSHSPWQQPAGQPLSVQVGLNWDTPDGYGITNYVAQLYEHNGDEFVKKDSSLTGVATFGDTQIVSATHLLYPDANYKYALTLRNAANETILDESMSIFIRSTAENPATEAPTNLTASLASDGSRVVLRWDAPEGNLWRYIVIRDWRYNGSVAATQSYVVDKSHTTYTDTNVGSSSGRTYEYRVRAVTGFYTSYVSTVVSVQIP